MNLGERVKKCRIKCGLSQKMLAESIGISQQALHHIESGTTANPRCINEIAKVLQVSPIFLLYGDENVIDKKLIKNFAPIISWKMIKTWYSGDLKFINSETELMPISNKLSANSYSLRVEGDSMANPVGGRPSFVSGDIIIVDPERVPKNNSFVIALINEKPTFKQYVEDEGIVYLKPLNPQYPMIKLTNKVTICGVVVSRVDNFD